VLASGVKAREDCAWLHRAGYVVVPCSEETPDMLLAEELALAEVCGSCGTLGQTEFFSFQRSEKRGPLPKRGLKVCVHCGVQEVTP